MIVQGVSMLLWDERSNMRQKNWSQDTNQIHAILKNEWSVHMSNNYPKYLNHIRFFDHLHYSSLQIQLKRYHLYQVI